MEGLPRYLRFANPFGAQLPQHHRRGSSGRAHWLYGFFRALPLHAWSSAEVRAVLAYAAHSPSLFGLPRQPTCIVDTSAFASQQQQQRQQQQQQHNASQRHSRVLGGLCVFGYERGCRTIVVPPACTRVPFDADDARALAPLFRWNPGVELVYLSSSCQPIAAQLTPYLTHCPKISRVVLPGWHDAVAVHRIMMACKHADVLDVYAPLDAGTRLGGGSNYITAARAWNSELAVQALTTLTEMHPRLRVVIGHVDCMGDWGHATRLSRCKHTVALITDSCRYTFAFDMLYCVCLMVLMKIINDVLHGVVCAWTGNALVAEIVAVVVAATTGSLMLYTEVRRRRVRGPMWMHVVARLLQLRARRLRR